MALYLGEDKIAGNIGGNAPTKTSQLSNDSGFITSADVLPADELVKNTDSLSASLELQHGNGGTACVVLSGVSSSGTTLPAELILENGDSVIKARSIGASRELTMWQGSSESYAQLTNGSTKSGLMLKHGGHSVELKAESSGATIKIDGQDIASGGSDEIKFELGYFYVVLDYSTEAIISFVDTSGRLMTQTFKIIGFGKVKLPENAAAISISCYDEYGYSKFFNYSVYNDNNQRIGYQDYTTDFAYYSGFDGLCVVATPVYKDGKTCKAVTVSQNYYTNVNNYSIVFYDADQHETTVETNPQNRVTGMFVYTTNLPNGLSRVTSSQSLTADICETIQSDGAIGSIDRTTFEDQTLDYTVNQDMMVALNINII